jgi:hypothetical protein
MKREKYILAIMFLTMISLFKTFAQCDFMYVGDYGPEIGVYPKIFYTFYAPNYIGLNERIYDADSNEFMERGIKSGPYYIDDSDGVLFITIDWIGKPIERYLLLVNDDFICLYNDDSEPVFRGVHYHYEDLTEWHFSGIMSIVNITASSLLIENGIAYTLDKIRYRINSAWAEGVEGPGIHESLFIQMPDLVGAIYLSIGYVSYSKPNLYRENSRPKRIRILQTGNKTNYEEFELKDTPNFQRIDIGAKFGRDIQIEILEVYPGTKYEDTCINNIVGLYEGAGFNRQVQHPRI